MPLKEVRQVEVSPGDRGLLGEVQEQRRQVEDHLCPVLASGVIGLLRGLADEAGYFLRGTGPLGTCTVNSYWAGPAGRR